MTLTSKSISGRSATGILDIEEARNYWLGAGLCVLVSALVFLLSTRHGIGIWPDSTRYMGLDANPYDAPGYTWLLWVGVTSGLSLAGSAKIFGLALVCANTFLIWHILAKATGRASYAAAGTLVVVLAPQFAITHALAMSEPLFIFFILTTFSTYSRFWASQDRRWLVACALSIGAASLVRFMAPPLGLAVALCALIDPRRPLRQRIMDAVLVGAISGAIFLAWVLLGKLLVGHATGRPLELNGNFGAEEWNSSFQTMTAFLLPAKVPGVLRNTLLLLLIALGVVLTAVHARRLLTSAKSSAGQAGMLPLLLAFSVIFYLGFFWVAAQVEANIHLNGRYALPAYVMAAMLLTILVSAFAPTGDRSKMAGRALAAAVACLLLIHAVRTADKVRDAYANGIGYAGVAWAHSPILQATAKLPPDATLYTNGADVIGYRLNRRASYIPARTQLRTGTEDPNNPYEKQVEALRTKLAEGNCFLVFIDRVDWRWYLAKEDDLVKQLQLETVASVPDGRIYSISPVGQP
jgi:4-amino-4-deoxy-L-arabinose transferase-like glycosyltransferase